MTTSLRNILIFIGVVILVFELGSRVYESSKKAEEANPIAKDGKIKENHTVTFEEEEELAIKSFPNVKDKEYNDNSMYAFTQCIMFAESTGENSWACLGNLIDENGQFKELKGRLNEEKGKYIYDFLTKDRQVTNAKVFPNPKESVDGQFYYSLFLSFERDSEVTEYEIEIQDRKINRIEEVKSESTTEGE